MKSSRTQNHPIGLSVSGIKYYDNNYYQNKLSSFAALSVTGTGCDCNCAHCNGILLQNMADAGTPEKFRYIIDKLSDSGCTGILVSGGSDAAGSVPLMPLAGEISYAKSKGLSVVVHTGLLSEEAALALKAAKVDHILLDVIGSEKTIKNVYGLDKAPCDFEKSMSVCKNAGLSMAPHLVVGLDFGEIDGEYHAIDMASRAGAESFVLVVLTPKRGTKMQGIAPPPLAEVEKVFKYAAFTLKDTHIMLGCARPFSYSVELEKLAVDLGFDAISYPHEETIQYIKDIGREMYFFEECCALFKSHQKR